MQEELKSLIEEGKEFARIKRSYDQARFPDVGTPAYIISSNWLNKYKLYAFFEELRYNMMPREAADDHLTAKHPGKIVNTDLLDHDAKFLQGTGEGSTDLEADVIDKYLSKDTRERINFDFVNEEMWNFLAERYGFDTVIKRYYAQKGGLYAVSEIDARLYMIPVCIVRADDLYAGRVAEQFKISYVQLSGKKSFSDAKKRVADVATAQLRADDGDAPALKSKNIRLWLAGDKRKLIESFQALGASEQRMEVDNQPIYVDSVEVGIAQKEENSGVKFPGESIEPYVGSQLIIEEIDFNDKVVIVEVSTPKFAYAFENAGRVQIGKCEFCHQRKVLSVSCQCKRVRYCDEACRKKDQTFHLPTCSAQADDELNRVSVQRRSSNGRNGIVGLQNLGNTCYMNSSLQCLSNTYELTNFFLESRFKFINELPVKNVLGTEGRLVMAYAKLINEMWNMNQSPVTPSMFKRILGEYAPMFAGYGQHDSHECINTILDLLGEDLYRQGKKPYMEQEEKEGQPEAEASSEAWNKHLVRNESVITDLFHGQFKSTLCCSQCDRVSVTFDPFMTLSLPIPKRKEPKDFFFMPYHIKEGYMNKSYKIRVGGSDNLRTLRTILHETYGLNAGSFVIAAVFNNDFMKLHTTSANVLEVAEEQGATLMYEIDPELQPSLPAQAMRQDAMYNVPADTTMLQLCMAKWGPKQYSDQLQKQTMIPRLLWAQKSITMKELHFMIFKHIRFVFSEWVDWSHPESERVTKQDKRLLKQLVPFPYRRNEGDSQLTKVEFDALTDEEAFALCCKDIIACKGVNGAQSSSNFSIESAPYQLEFKNTAGVYATCKLCDSNSCKNCLVPYTDDVTLQDLLDKLGLRRNDTLFDQMQHLRGKELICQVTWHKDINLKLFDFLATAMPGERLPDAEDAEEATRNQSSDIQLSQCLTEFKQSETLDEENQWYCGRCKEFVRATKTMEIYRVPRILIISLKRFKTSRNRYGFGGGQKIDTLVEFPLEGLDMRQFVLSEEQSNSKLIYDCYGISNHFGSVGFGHYTAYGRNPLDGRWYDFNDSNVQPLTEATEKREGLVTSAAYNLFFRLRTNDTMETMDFDKLTQHPDMELLNSLGDENNNNTTTAIPGNKAATQR